MLVAWHEIAARWDGVIASHNYPIPLTELAPEDGKIPFWVENQGTWVWAFDPDSADHTVYERAPSDEPEPWQRTGEGLSAFLAHATVLEALLCAPEAKIARNVGADWLREQQGSRALPFPTWNWPAPESRLFCGERWLALVYPSDDSEAGHDITVAATTPEALSWVENTPDVTWRSYSGSHDHTTDEPPPW
ncbi:hypothetical protein RM844_15435 [Streptomyces sp. DSM 44915]|uniref:Immunity protein 35 domain-containing protein n=1 Tax=Streptomyces chisholmiae TaxID=3075540 RepID=A0ABU2JT54_9ACTN|nr:hypothetical protein [Streptomyces sp. DSM 44915]MDT0267679.1 hypothetical protein [Streptomyces sp. DSM 44915]